MKRLLVVLLASAVLLGAISGQNARGIQTVKVTDEQGNQVDLYKGSYALVIGVSAYDNGWPPLPGVKKDLQRVSAALAQSGFTVTVVQDPDGNQLKDAYANFINQYGQDVENRLLFYFAGHGHTLKQSYGEEMGYVVPRDAPNPSKDPGGFIAKAMDMQMVEVFAKRIQSKHALFIFDSCFSGSLFAMSRAIPESISYRTSRPVREFITSGSADEYVADDSIFCGQFIEALNGEADFDHDGYVTGTELGLFLQDKVINYSHNSQHPQYGKIRNPNLDKGDFVFAIPAATAVKQSPPAAMAPASAAATQTPPAAASPQASEKTTASTQPEAAAQAAPTEEPAHTNSVVIETVPTPAEVYVDGTLKGTSPLNLPDVSLGEHQITARRAGYKDGVGSLTVTKFTSEFSLTVELRKQVDNVVSASGIELVRLPAGSYSMGSIRGDPDEQPVHPVTFAKPLLFGQYEITNAQFCEVMNGAIAKGQAVLSGGDLKGGPGTDGRTYLGIQSLAEKQFGIRIAGKELAVIPGREEHPVTGVSWYGAVAFCNFLSDREGLPRVYDLPSSGCAWQKGGYRLPTEAEWEYAACGSDIHRYPWGDTIDGRYANYFGSADPLESANPPYTENGGPTTPLGYYDGSTHGSFATQDSASVFGAYDLLGNAYEWCWDWAGAYPADAQTDPTGPVKGTKRVYRGGSWISTESLLYSTKRFSDYNPWECVYVMGFRVVRPAE